MTYPRCRVNQSLHVGIPQACRKWSRHVCPFSSVWDRTDQPSKQVQIQSRIQSQGQSTASPTSPDAGDVVGARAREGRLRKLAGRKATQFLYGGSSLFQLQLEPPLLMELANPSPTSVTATAMASAPPIADVDVFPYHAHGDTCRQLMAAFFQNVYHYYHCVYREYFLRDYAAGGGPYYSDMLLSCICAGRRADLARRGAAGAVRGVCGAGREPPAELAARAGADDAAGAADPGAAGDWPRPRVQGLAVLRHGLSADARDGAAPGPDQLERRGGVEGGKATTAAATLPESSVDREILRRVYWAAFIVDKQLSLYFGRPPALYPHEADVRNTIRIPYPPEWESLLDTYISRSTSATAFEDGVPMVGSFIHQAELAKILHAMIVDVFENRQPEAAEEEAAEEEATVRAADHVHERLLRWLSLLPQKLHWHPWTAGRVAPYVLHLHMLFHRRDGCC